MDTRQCGHAVHRKRYSPSSRLFSTDTEHCGTRWRPSGQARGLLPLQEAHGEGCTQSQSHNRKGKNKVNASLQHILKMNVSKEADAGFMAELERTDPERYRKLIR